MSCVIGDVIFHFYLIHNIRLAPRQFQSNGPKNWLQCGLRIQKNLTVKTIKKKNWFRIQRANEIVPSVLLVMQSYLSRVSIVTGFEDNITRSSNTEEQSHCLYYSYEAHSSVRRLFLRITWGLDQPVVEGINHSRKMKKTKKGPVAIINTSLYIVGNSYHFNVKVIVAAVDGHPFTIHYAIQNVSYTLT